MVAKKGASISWGVAPATMFLNVFWLDADGSLLKLPKVLTEKISCLHEGEHVAKYVSDGQPSARAL